MEDDSQSSAWKSVQRLWKDVLSRISRRCKIPKQLIIFAIFIIAIMTYTVFNNQVLRISDDLLKLQEKVDIKESFETKIIDLQKIGLQGREESLVVPNEEKKEEEEKKASLWDESVRGKRKDRSKKPAKMHLREEGHKQKGVEERQLKLRGFQPLNVSIEATLSQILPVIVSDEERDPAFSMSYQFTYPAFVIPPPLTVEANSRNTLPVISGFFRELASHKRDDCKNEDICVHPSKYHRIYIKWDCDQNSCKNDNDYIVFFQKEYTTGQIDVIQDGKLPLNYGCSPMSNHKEATLPTSSRVYELPGTVVYLLVPKGFTLHQFIASILPKLVQMESILADPSLRFLVDISPQTPIVSELYDRLGITADRRIDVRSIKHMGELFGAKQLVVSCKAPSLHPYLWQRAQYLLKLPHLVDPEKFKPRRILYLTRKRGTMNGGRKVVNEGPLEGHLKQFAQTHGYEYTTFIHSDYKTLEATMELWSTAAVVIGPHGGAFSNLLFAPKGCMVIEFLPNGAIFTGTTFKDHLAPYMQAMVLGHQYYAVMSQFSKRDDITVNIREVLEILDHLPAI